MSCRALSLALVLGLAELAASADCAPQVRLRSGDPGLIAKIQTALDGVMALVNPFTESAEKQVLVDAVRDSFRHPDEVQKEWDKTAPLLDELYARCQDNEAA